MYAVNYLTMKMSINDIKIKILFNNDVEINCMLKRLINATQFFICQENNIIIINFINKRARFFNVYKSIFVNIKNIIISIFIFVIECFDYDFFLNRFFSALFV